MSFWFNLNVFKGILWQHSQSRTAYLRQWKKRLRIRQVNGQDCSAQERTASTTWELQTAIDQDQRRAPLCATWSLFPFISAPPYFSLTPCFQNNLSPASQSISHHSVMSSQKAQVGHICTLSLYLLLNVVYLFFKKLEFILPVKPSQSWNKNDFSPLPVDDLRTSQLRMSTSFITLYNSCCYSHVYMYSGLVITYFNTMTHFPVVVCLCF